MIAGKPTEVWPTLWSMSSKAVGVAVSERLAPTQHGAEARRGRAVARAAINEPPDATTPLRHVFRSASFR